MSITVTNLTLAATYSKSELEQNFADIVNKFGAITNGDIHASAGILPSKLSASLQELWLTLTVGTIAGGLPGGNTVLAVVPFPGSNGDGSWVVRDISWACTDTGAGTGQIKVAYGEFSGVGVWTEITALLSGEVLANANAANDANDKKALENGSQTISYQATATNIALLGTTAEAGTLSAAGSLLSVTVRMTRVLQSA